MKWNWVRLSKTKNDYFEYLVGSIVPIPGQFSLNLLDQMNGLYTYQLWRHKITTEVHLYVKIWKKNENSNEVYNFTYKTLVSWYVFS